MAKIKTALQLPTILAIPLLLISMLPQQFGILKVERLHVMKHAKANNVLMS
jgi:hypothetical protein